MTVDDDERAVFGDLYRVTYQGVLAFLRRRVDPHHAEDLAADVYMAAWRGWRGVPEHERTPWLYGIARNLAANSYRTDARHRALELRATERVRDSHDEVADSVLGLDLRIAWARLPDADREVLALVSWDGLTGREAALVLGCTRAAFSVRLTRARRRLRRLLDGVDPMVGTSTPEPCTASTKGARREHSAQG